MKSKISYTLLLLAAITPAHLALAVDSRVIEATSQNIAPAPSAIVDDIGDIRPVSSKPWLDRLRVTATLRTEYVSNAKLIGNHGSGDVLFTPGVRAEYSQALPHGFSFDLGVREETFLYASNSDFSFWGFSGLARLNYQPTDKCPTLYIAVEPYWYSSIRNGNELSKALGFSGGIEKNYVFNRDRTLVFFGYNFSSYYADPIWDGRDLHRLIAGVTQKLSPKLNAQLYYAFELSEYRHADREDLRHVAGLNFIYTLNDHWTLDWSTTYVVNNSDAANGDYQNVSSGLGLSYRF